MIYTLLLFLTNALPDMRKQAHKVPSGLYSETQVEYEYVRWHDISIEID